MSVNNEGLSGAEILKPPGTWKLRIIRVSLVSRNVETVPFVCVVDWKLVNVLRTGGSEIALSARLEDNSKTYNRKEIITYIYVFTV